jgi:hypothetical protein
MSAIEGKDILRRLDVAVARCVAAGKIAGTAYIGGEAGAALKAHLDPMTAGRPVIIRTEAQAKRGVTMGETFYGTVPIRVRPSLDESVIVESTDGEPFIVEPGGDVE